MKSDFFIDRPVFSTVLSVVIVIVGLFGTGDAPRRPVSAASCPRWSKVSASYPGASAQTVTQAVATPYRAGVERNARHALHGVDEQQLGRFLRHRDLRHIDTDPDLAAVEIQNRVKQAEARLPAEVVQNGISVEKQASSRLMTITLLSNDPKFDEIYLSVTTPRSTCWTCCAA